MSDNRNATSSWSGYSHQGSLGIFVALQKINKLKNNEEDITNWKVIYENAEDFDIQNDGSVDSRHQVKAHKDAKYPNDIKDVLSIQKYELVDGVKKLTVKGFEICKFDDYCNPLTIQVNNDSRYIHVITEIKGFELNRTDFEREYSQATYVENPNNIKLFEYPDNKKFCSLDDYITRTDKSKIKEFCKNEIKIILERIGHPKKGDNSFFSGIYDGLQFLLDEEIRQKHILGSGNYPELDFKKIYDYITLDNDLIQSDIFRLRSSFYNVYLKYKIELDDEGIEVHEYEKDIDKLIHEIYIMDDDKFIKFLENIHIDKNDFNINMNINEDGLKEVFFYCLFNYKYFDQRRISFKNSEDLIFVLTTINSTRVSLSKDIINNHNITESLFKNNYIINLYKSESLFNTISTLKNFTQYQNDNNWKDLEETMDRYVSDNDFFLHPKDIKLIKISDLEEQNLEKVLND